MSKSIYITRIKLESFGCFGKGLDIELKPSGISLVLGPNEAGKSTLVMAVKAILFGLRSEEISVYQPWNSRHNFAGEMHLRITDTDGKSETFKIERNFATNEVVLSAAEIERNSATNEVALSAAEGETVLFSGKANPASRSSNEAKQKYFSILTEKIGVPDEKLFTETICVNQLEMETKIDSELRQILTGSASGDYKSIIEKLEKEYFDLTKTAYASYVYEKRNDRRIEQLRGEINEKRAGLNIIRDSKNELDRNKKRQQELVLKIEQLHKEKGEKEKRYETLSRCYDLNKEIEDLAKEHNELKNSFEKIKETDRKLKDAESRRDEIGYKEPPPKDFHEKLYRLGTILKDTEDNQQKISHLHKQPPPSRLKLFKNPFLLVAAVVFVSGIIGGLMFDSLALSLAGFAIAGVCAAWAYAEISRHRAESKGQLDLLTKTISANREEQKKIFGELSLWLKAETFDAVDIEHEKERYQKYRDFSEEAETCKEILKNLPNKGETEQTLKKIEADLGRKQIEIRGMLKDNLALKIFLEKSDNYHDLQILKSQIGGLIDEIDKAVREKIEIEAEIKAIERVLNTNDIDLAEEIKQREEELKGCEQQVEALQIAIMTLKESVTEFNSVHKEGLAEEIGNHLSAFTGGKYSRLTLDDDFVPSVDHPEKQKIDSSRLSVGTRDQLFFAMRLALATELGENARFPFILDDPFVNFDDDRLERVIGVLGNVCAQRQIIILSHDRRLIAYIPEPVELEN